ncbi:MAG: lipoyl(octanoyl) transferase LipB [Weeksellaceae bacterium]|nr:lipoyl(octanoyl) transferase LipB [Weeksellaceae bacterium]
MNIPQNKSVNFRDLGQGLDYQNTWDEQEKALQEIVDLKLTRRRLERLIDEQGPPEDFPHSSELVTPNHLWFLEHPHVYTLGKSGDESNLLANAAQLQSIEATYVKTNRGGDITYHGPGQLVGYPILDLENFRRDINWYLRSLEEVIINVLEEYGLRGQRSHGETGVWLDTGTPFARKICAMGVKASHWVSMHGFALNVNTDLRYFEYIIPCGIKDKQVTSLQRELDRDVDMEEVKAKVKAHFEQVFDCELSTE